MHGTLGRYRIVRPLGEGGMGRLYLAESARGFGFVKRVVLKVVRDQRDDGLRASLIEEARLMATLVHRNLVSVLDLEEAGDQQLVVLEHVDGMDLARLVRERGPLPWDLAAFVGQEIAAGLDYAHRRCDGAGRPLRIVHRDVSAANVVLSWEGEVKLTDFGVASVDRPGARSRGRDGNYAYMPPEQARAGAVDVRADVYALGVVLYEAITGRHPRRKPTTLATLAAAFEGRIPLLPAGRAPEALRAIVARATDPHAEARFPSAAAMREALMALEGLPPDPGRRLAGFLAGTRAPRTGAALLSADLAGERPNTRPAEAPPSVRREPLPFAALAAVAALAVSWPGALTAPPTTAVVSAPALTVARPIVPAAPPAAVPAAVPAPVPALVPAPAAERAAPCVLTLASQPSGAKVRVSGMRGRFQTPARVEVRCREAPYRVAVSRSGYSRWRGAVVVEKSSSVEAILSRRTRNKPLVANRWR